MFARRAFTIVELLVVIAILGLWLRCCCPLCHPFANRPGGLGA